MVFQFENFIYNLGKHGKAVPSNYHLFSGLIIASLFVLSLFSKILFLKYMFINYVYSVCLHVGLHA